MGRRVLGVRVGMGSGWGLSRPRKGRRNRSWISEGICCSLQMVFRHRTYQLPSVGCSDRQCTFPDLVKWLIAHSISALDHLGTSISSRGLNFTAFSRTPRPSSSLPSQTSNPVTLHLLAMSYNCASSLPNSFSLASDPALGLSSASFNVSDLLAKRLEDGTSEERDRLNECWKYTFRDCGDCHRSQAGCGWCAVLSYSNS